MGENVSPSLIKISLFWLLILGMIPMIGWSAGLPIEEIRVEGTFHVPESKIREAIQIQIGQDLSRYDVQILLREDVKRIARVRGVRDVTVATEPTVDGLRLVFEILEYPMLEDIRFSGNRRYDDNRLRRELGFIKRAGFFRTEQADVFYSPMQLRRYLEKLRDLYQEKGYATVQVTSSLEDEKENTVVLRFDIKEGKKQVIRGTQFEGVTAFENKDLLKRIRSKKAWIPFFPRKYDQDQVDLDVERLKRYYEDAGYYRVNVSQLDSDVVDDGKGVILRFGIAEGDPYDYGEVRVMGNQIFADEELLADRTTSGDVRFNRSELEKDTFNLGDVYRAQGYIFTSVSPLLSARDEEQKVDVTWEIRESPRYRLRQVNLEGVVEADDGTVEPVSLKTKDKVILREIQLKSGDILDWTRVRASEQRLLNLAYFKREPEVYPARLKHGFQPEAVEGVENELDLHLRLEEEPTGMISFGAGYSTTFGASIFAGIQERNLFGRGWRGSLSGSFGTKRQSAILSLTDPYFMDTDYLVGVDLYHTYRDAYGGREFDETRVGGAIRVGREIAENLRATFQYKYESIKVGDIDKSGLQDTIRPDPYVEGKSKTSAISLTLVHDTRDYAPNPSSGHRYAGTVELAGIGGDNEFWKVQGNASWYRLLTDKLIFAYDIEAGVAQGYGGTDILPLHERFFTGGANSVRGFEEAGIGPRGIYAITRRRPDGQVYSDVDRVVIGGELELVSRSELRYPFTDQIQGVLFLDTGASWEEVSDFDLSELRVSTGLGVRINLPIGASVRLDVGFPLKKESGDDTQVFHFGFNQSF